MDKPRKTGLNWRELLVVLAIMVAIVMVLGHGSPRFWGDFSGMTESQVIDRLGQPFRDNRQNGEGNADEYILGWDQGFEVGLFLHFKKGVVVSQERFTR